MKRKLALLAAALLFALPLFAQEVPNLNSIVLPSAARTATTVTTTDQANPTWQKAHVIINVSAYTSGTYTPTVQGKDPISSNYYTLLVGPAIGATGMTILKIGPGIAPLANGAVNDILPKIWRITFAGAATPSMTFSVGALLEP